ncbi:MAG: hypothetical protein HY720_15320 [Planctomycetes bacterium]|nr:hypothetical protein [Planctomycetota bacterium]
MSDIFETVILIALPASGKSEVRKFIAGLDAAERRSAFHLGDTVQLDDFPYVHFFRRIDEELRGLGRDGIFFHSPDRPFRNPVDWGTLILLLNEDHACLLSRTKLGGRPGGGALLERIDRARDAVGGGRPLAALPADARGRVAAALDREAREFHAGLDSNQPASLSGKTVVLEFARGGPDGASMPLSAPFGYAYSLSRLSPAILAKAALLYIWVTPEESRRKNTERADPNDPGSILHHGVPIEVMMKDYGTDDVEHLLSTSGRPDTVTIQAHGRTFSLPLARFDNRVDRTSFVRRPRGEWKAEEIRALHDGLASAFQLLWKRRPER